MTYVTITLCFALTSRPSPSIQTESPSSAPGTMPAQWVGTSPAMLDRGLDDHVVLILGNNTPEARRIGARGLLAIGNAEAFRRLGMVLQRDSDPAAQIAICGELAATESALPDELIPPVLRLLSVSRREVCEAAVRAIARFSHSSVIPQLSRMAAGVARATGESRAAIAALGRFGASPAAIDALLEVCAGGEPASAPSATRATDGRNVANTNGGMDAETTTAVLAALERATGVAFVDVTEARHWWAAKRQRDLAGYLQERDARRERAVQTLETRVDELTRRLVDYCRADYLARTDAEKTTVLLTMLGDGEPALRGLGLELTNALITDRKPVPAAIVGRVRVMLSDSMPEVRRAAALVLADVRDASDVSALRDALSREALPRVRAALLKSLGRLADSSALGLFFEALDDPSREVRLEAIAAIGALSERIAATSTDAHRSVDALLLQLNQVNGGDDAAIEAVLEALARFADARSAPAFARFLSPAWPPGIRQSAIRGAAMLPDGKMTDAICAALSDGHVGVRLAAAGALGACGRGEAHMSALAARLEPAVEPEEAIRRKAWESLARLLTARSRVEQCQWAQRLPMPADSAAATGRIEWLTRLLKEVTEDTQLSDWRPRVGECLADALLAAGQIDAALAAFQRALNANATASAPSSAPSDPRLIYKAVRTAIRNQRGAALAELLPGLTMEPDSPLAGSQTATGPSTMLVQQLNETERIDAARLLAGMLYVEPATSQPAFDEQLIVKCLRQLAPGWEGIPTGADAAGRAAAIDQLQRRISPSVPIAP